MDERIEEKGSLGRSLTLTLAAEAHFVPVVLRFVEESVQSFGMGREEALKLCLAAEEVFLYLCRRVCPAQSLDIRCNNGVYYGEVQFAFLAASLNLPGLNLAAGLSWEDEADGEEMGLLLAARSVDRLWLDAETHRRVRLGLVKERAYPAAPEQDLPLVPAAAGATCRRPDGEMLQRFALQAARYRREPLQPAFLSFPGKVVDMVAGGEFVAVVAVTEKDAVAGGLLYRFRSEKIVHGYGPYLFCLEEAGAVGKALLDDLLGRVARTQALGVVHDTDLPGFLQADFESLGEIEDRQAGGGSLPRRFFFRHLHEDPGGTVWSCGALTPYLRQEYDRLCLGREIREVRDLGEAKAEASIFSAEVCRERSEVVLRPLWPGKDAAANVERHLRFLQAEGVRNLLCEVDLGLSWQAGLAPVLLEKGFQPRVVLPFAGQADLVVFHCHADGPTVLPPPSCGNSSLTSRAGQTRSCKGSTAASNSGGSTTTKTPWDRRRPPRRRSGPSRRPGGPCIPAGTPTTSGRPSPAATAWTPIRSSWGTAPTRSSPS